MVTFLELPSKFLIEFFIDFLGYVQFDSLKCSCNEADYILRNVEQSSMFNKEEKLSSIISETLKYNRSIHHFFKLSTLNIPKSNFNDLSRYVTTVYLNIPIFLVFSRKEFPNLRKIVSYHNDSFQDITASTTTLCVKVSSVNFSTVTYCTEHTYYEEFKRALDENPGIENIYINRFDSSNSKAIINSKRDKFNICLLQGCFRCMALKLKTSGKYVSYDLDCSLTFSTDEKEFNERVLECLDFCRNCSCEN